MPMRLVQIGPREYVDPSQVVSVDPKRGSPYAIVSCRNGKTLETPLDVSAAMAILEGKLTYDEVCDAARLDGAQWLSWADA